MANEMERLSIEVVEDAGGGAVTFRLRGRLDVFTYVDLKKSMDPYLEKAAGKCWLVDLTEVPFVASSGWSVFIATRTRLKRIEGRLALVGMGQDLIRIYQSMKMGDLVPAYPTLAEARQSMGLEAGR